MKRESGFFKVFGTVNGRTALLFLLLLVSTDLVFVGLNLLRGIASYLNFPSFLSSNLFELGRDHGYPEVYQYVKEFWVVVLILFIYYETKEKGYIAWALLFTYLLCDDAICIHERFGAMIAANLEFVPYFGLRLQDIGELAVTIVSATILLTSIGYFNFKGSKNFRETSLDLLVLLMAVAFFGVFIDMVHMAVRVGREGNFIFRIVEDGGEMITISMVACYVFFLKISDISLARVSLSRIVVVGLLNRFRVAAVEPDSV